MIRQSPNLYAEALLSALEGAPKEKALLVLKRFVTTVAKHGDANRWDEILRAVEKKRAAQKGGRSIEVEFARKGERRLEEKFKHLFGTHDIVQFRVDPTLVAGARITIDGDQELDLSFARLLNDLLPTGN